MIMCQLKVTRRSDLISAGLAITRPEAVEGAPSEAQGHWQ